MSSPQSVILSKAKDLAFPPPPPSLGVILSEAKDLFEKHR